MKWEKGYAPAAFNDYMNCLWALPNREKLIPLIDAAAESGAELFCMDDGWQLDSLGTWSINDEKYGEDGLSGIVKYIQSKGVLFNERDTETFSNFQNIDRLPSLTF